MSHMQMSLVTPSTSLPRIRRTRSRCSVLQCVAVCCSALKCVAVCCNVLYFYAVALLVSGACGTLTHTYAKLVETKLVLFILNNMHDIAGFTDFSDSTTLRTVLLCLPHFTDCAVLAANTHGDVLPLLCLVAVKASAVCKVK